jgi:hypothetical protein
MHQQGLHFAGNSGLYHFSLRARFMNQFERVTLAANSPQIYRAGLIYRRRPSRGVIRATFKILDSADRPTSKVLILLEEDCLVNDLTNFS